MIKVTIRDGRINRDESKVTDEGGEVLHEFEAEQPIEVDQLLTLPDGSEVVVIGLRERIDIEGWRQTVFVGNTWEG